MSNQPVFFDPRGTRHRRVSFWAASLGLVLAILTTAVIASLSVVPLLPKVKGLSGGQHKASHLIPRLPDANKRKDVFLASKARQLLNQEVAKDKRRRQQQQAAAKKSPVGSAVVAAFYATWQEVGITSYRENAKNLTHVLPLWLGLDRKDPSKLDFTNYDVATTSEGKSAGQELIDISRAHGVRIWPVLQNLYDGVTDKGVVHTLLASPETQKSLIDATVKWLKQRSFDGVNVDFEGLDPSDYDRLPAFLEEFHKSLGANGLSLSIDLEAGNDDLRIRKLAQNVDLVIVMVYDDHYEGGTPGPIAPIDWTQQVMAKYGQAVPQNKLVIGIGSYAYDWAKDQQTAAPTFQAALKTAEGYRDDESAADVIDFDDQSLNAHFTYDDDANVRHEVWLLDGASAFNQWKIARDVGVRGAALWALGTEDPSIWSFLNRESIDRDPDPKALKTVRYGPDELEFVGSGDILYAKGEPKTATREVEVDQDTGLIDSETYDGYPSSYYIQKAGFPGPKTLALTFDDGPDPANTPAILDVLKRYGVPATFFVIGRNAMANPELVQRMVAQGDEVGSHTFNHPNLDVTSNERTEYELNATERLIQEITGRTTVLFRPPYNADSEPRNPDDIRPIIVASNLGYITVGESIDPQDWRLHENFDDTGPLRSPDEIVNAILYQLSQRDHGNVILLHDGGGDRTATAAALDALIPKLQSKGYKFVSVSGLMGQPRDAVMPPVTAKDRTLIGLDKFAFTTIFVFEWILRLAFLIAIALGIARVLLITPLAIIHERRKVRETPGFQPPVSVLIAAFNEEKVISRTIRSILASHYPVDQVIVVDDGSSDGTFLQIVTEFAGEERVIALQQRNAGKAVALNRALSQSHGEVVLCIDADTQLDPDAVGLLVRHFADRQVGAVAGNVKVGNRLNLLTKWQSVEYITSQNLDRRAYALLNGISVCPGALGAWRRTALIEAGGYLSDTLAEDMDLTWRLRRVGWKVGTESHAVAHTEVPDTFRGFFIQRFRWAYGTLQCLWKHRGALGRHGWFGRLTLPALWLFQIVFQVLAPLVDVQLLYTAILFFAAWITSSAYSKDWRPVGDVQQTLVSVAFLYGLFFLLELVSGFIAYRMDRERKGELWWLFLQRFVYRQIMYAVIFKSISTAIRGRRQGWGKLERKATVELEKREVPRKAALK